MKRTIIIFFLYVVLIPAALILTISLADAQDKSFTYSKISADKNGITHFAKSKIAIHPYGVMNIYYSTLVDVTSIRIFRAPPEFAMSWHPAHYKQFVIVLSGAMEVESGDGEKRQFQPGEVLLVEDTAGQGHKTRSISKEELICAYVRLDE